jgi:hypothetical protein
LHENLLTDVDEDGVFAGKDLSEEARVHSAEPGSKF